MHCRIVTGSIALSLSMCAGTVHAGESRVYRTQLPSEPLPVFTDRPINRTSRLVATFAPQKEVVRAIVRSREGGNLKARRAAVEPLVRRAALKYGVSPALLKAVIEVESGFNASARSPKGAAGLMQVMPATAARYGRFDLYSPEQNIEAGTRYLRDLLTMFGGRLDLAVAAYNAGENAVIRNGRRIPPYQETQRYVPMVLERYRQYLPAEDGVETSRMPQQRMR